MAIRTFNSVGGFSVGEIPDTIILAMVISQPISVRLPQT